MKEHCSGAIVYTIKNNVIYYILIQEYNGNIGFPKGHIEKDESKEMCAYREVMEETGLSVTLSKEIVFTISYSYHHVKKEVDYFIAYVKDISELNHGELLCYCVDYNEALSKLSYTNLKKEFIKCNELIVEGKCKINS